VRVLSRVESRDPRVEGTGAARGQVERQVEVLVLPGTAVVQTFQRFDLELGRICQDLRWRPPIVNYEA